MAIILWAERARKDLIRIYEFIRKDSLESAQKVVQAIISATKTLKPFPKRGRFVPELSDSITREVIVIRKYRVVYEISEETIQILAILHTSRQFRLKTGPS